MKSATVILVALAAFLLIASQLAPGARGQGTLIATTVPPRKWPPRPEDMVAVQVSPPGGSVTLQQGEELLVYRVLPGQWLILLETEVLASSGVRLLASGTSGSPQTEADAGVLAPGVAGAPFGLACPPGTRLYVRYDSSFGTATYSGTRIWGYLVDA